MQVQSGGVVRYSEMFIFGARVVQAASVILASVRYQAALTTGSNPERNLDPGFGRQKLSSR